MKKNLDNIEVEVEGCQNFHKTKHGWVWFKNIKIPRLTLKFRKHGSPFKNNNFCFELICLKKFSCNEYEEGELMGNKKGFISNTDITLKGLQFTETSLVSKVLFFRFM